jgi:hypothetical protein
MEIFGAEFCGTVAVIGLQRDKKKKLYQNEFEEKIILIYLFFLFDFDFFLVVFSFRGLKCPVFRFLLGNNR